MNRDLYIKSQSPSIVTDSGGHYIGGNMPFSYKLDKRVAPRLIVLTGSGESSNDFNIEAGFGATVNTVAIQSDGKILVGGDFTSYQGINRNYMVRLNIDGSFDSTFNMGNGFGSIVRAIAIQPDGKILVGGDFAIYQGFIRNRIVRLNTDGTIDLTFNIGTGFNSSVLALAIQSDGKIVVGGSFTTYQGTTSNYIVRLNTNGSFDSTFNMGAGFTWNVNTIAIQSDGKIIVGGQFTNYQGTNRNRIVRLNTDGSFDSTFNIGTGFNSSVLALAIQSDGKIVVGGSFTTYQGTTSNYIVRLNTNGSIDSAFNIGTGFGTNVRALAIQSDGKIVVGGDFTTYQGTTNRNRIARLNSDGNIDTTFNMGAGFNTNVLALAIKSDGEIVVVGQFAFYNFSVSSILRTAIAKYSKNGSLVTNDIVGTANTGSTVEVNAIAMQSDGKVLVGGSFTAYQGATRNRLFRLNTDGSVDPTFSVASGFDSTINTIEIQPDGKILVGGNFLLYKGGNVTNLVRLNSDGNLDTTYIPESVVEGVNTIKIIP